MGCGCEQNLTDEQRFGVAETTLCEDITVDLLVLYKRPIDCYLKYSLWGSIPVSKEDLEAASSFLESFIQQKINNPSDCTGIENLMNVRMIVNILISKGVCL